MARRTKQPAQPLQLPLRCNDLLFVNEYLRNGRNATKAYQLVHPTASYQTASRCAHDVLKKAPVKDEIARRVQYDAGITKELVQTALLEALQLAREASDHVAISSISMDCAKLAGFLVEKREVKTITEQESTAIRELVRSAMRPVTSTAMQAQPSGNG